MQSDQELFAKGLATYQKVVNLNYMAHRRSMASCAKFSRPKRRISSYFWTSPAARLPDRPRP